MMDQGLQQQYIEQYIKAYNAFDTEAMVANLHEAIEFKNISNGEVNMHTKGIEAFRQQAEQVRQFFQTREQRLTNLSFDTDTVTVEINYHAVLAMDLPNGMKKDDELKLKGKSIFRFKDHKIIAITDIS